MKIAAIALGLALAVSASACGAAPSERGAAAGDPLRAPPPVEAIDEAPPAGALLWLEPSEENDATPQDEELLESDEWIDEWEDENPEPFEKEEAPRAGEDVGTGSIHSFAFCEYTADDAASSEADAGECPDASPAEIEKARADWRARLEAVRPAPGSSPRAIAKLGLPDGERAVLVAWRSAAGRLCTELHVLDSRGRSTGGVPGGACVASGECDDLCLESSRHDDSHLLGGTVVEDADELRVVQAGARSVATRSSDRRFAGSRTASSCSTWAGGTTASSSSYATDA